MNLTRVRCPSCYTPVLDSEVNRYRFSRCNGCDSLTQTELFPAFFRPANLAREGENVLVDGESTCFYHASKKAVIPCQGCGRFLCALCDCEINLEHFCPVCLEGGRVKGKIKNLQNERTRYDKVALSLAVLPILIFYFTIITAPLALFIALRYWKAPQSLVHSTRFRHILAIGLATIQILAWGIGIYFVAGNFNVQ